MSKTINKEGLEHLAEVLDEKYQPLGEYASKDVEERVAIFPWHEEALEECAIMDVGGMFISPTIPPLTEGRTYTFLINGKERSGVCKTINLGEFDGEGTPYYVGNITKSIFGDIGMPNSGEDFCVMYSPGNGALISIEDANGEREPITSFAVKVDEWKNKLPAQAVDGLIPYLVDGWEDVEVNYQTDGLYTKLYTCSLTELPTKAVVNGEEYDLEPWVYEGIRGVGNLDIMYDGYEDGACPIMAAEMYGQIVVYSVVDIESLKVLGKIYTNKITPEVVDDAVYEKALSYGDNGIESLYALLNSSYKIMGNSHDAIFKALFDANDISKNEEKGFVCVMDGVIQPQVPNSRVIAQAGRAVTIPFTCQNAQQSAQYLRIASTTPALSAALNISASNDNTVIVNSPSISVVPGEYKFYVYDSRNPMTRSQIMTLEVFGSLGIPQLLCSKVTEFAHNGQTKLCISAYTTPFSPSQLNVSWKDSNGNAILTSTTSTIQLNNGQYLMRSCLIIPKDSEDDEIAIELQHYTTPPRSFTIKTKQ